MAKRAARLGTLAGQRPTSGWDRMAGKMTTTRADILDRVGAFLKSGPRKRRKVSYPGVVNVGNSSRRSAR
jgi:hypothetical protein